MARGRKFSDLLSTSDAAASWVGRIYWLFGSSLIGGGVLIPAISSFVGYWFGSFQNGLLAGAVLGLLVVGFFGLRTLALFSAGTPSTEQTALSPKELFEENQRLEGRVKELEGEIERINEARNTDFEKRCANMVEQLRLFLNDRELCAPEELSDSIHALQDPGFLEIDDPRADYDSETLRLYRQNYEGKVLSILRQAKERGLIAEDEIKLVSDLSSFRVSPQIQRVVNRLESCL